MTTTRQLVDEWTGRTSKGTVVAGSLVTALRTLLYERESVSAPRETFYWVTISSPVASENWTYRTTKAGLPSYRGVRATNRVWPKARCFAQEGHRTWNDAFRRGNYSRCW